MNPEGVSDQLTPIQQFYDGKSILITGATGFVGRILMEKLLRSCPRIGTIFVLVRPKSGKGIKERIEEMLEDKLFDLVRKEDGNFKRKVVSIRGDCTIPRLGMDQEDVDRLSDEVSIVFHAASTGQPVEAFSVATVVNIFGTIEVLKLAANMVKLECFLYVSSAYGFYPLHVVEEKVYEGNLKPRELLAMLEYENAEEKFDRIEEKILQWCPSVIPFTKGLAEHLVQEYGQWIPVAIFRPSLITSAYKEPYSSYTMKPYGVAGIVSAAICGILKSLPCDPQVTANLVPVDMCVNCMVTIPWRVSSTFAPPRCKNKDSIPVFNFESGTNRPITWKEFVEKSTRGGLRCPPSGALWCYSLTLQNNQLFHYISMVFQHFIPAVFYDSLLFLFGKKSRYWKMLMRAIFLVKSMEHLTKRNTLFISKNVPALLDEMAEEDKKIFCFDLQKLHWDEYFESYFLGIRLWALKDPMSTMKLARKKYWRFQVLDKIISCVYTATFLYVFYSFMLYVIVSEWI